MNNDFSVLVSQWLTSPAFQSVYCVGKAGNEFVFAVNQQGEFYVGAPDELEEYFITQCIDPKFNCLTYNFSSKTISTARAMTEERKKAIEHRDNLLRSIEISETYSPKKLSKDIVDFILTCLANGKILGGQDMWNHYDSLHWGGALYRSDDEYKFAHIEIGNRNEDPNKLSILSTRTTYFSGNQNEFKKWLEDQSERSLLRGTKDENHYPQPIRLNQSLIKSLIQSQ